MTAQSSTKEPLCSSCKKDGTVLCSDLASGSAAVLCRDYEQKKRESVRHLMPFVKKMERYKAEIERMMYAAENACQASSLGECERCPFTHGHNREHCTLYTMRAEIGDYFIPEEVTPCR